MNFHLLDAGGAGLYYLVIGIFVAFIIVAILLEAVVMQQMKYNVNFKKALLDSFVANVVTLAMGFVLIEYISDYFNSTEWPVLLILYGITVLTEWGVLCLLNKAHSVKRALIVSLLMNLVSYSILFLIGIGR
jgi:ABC-type uncharacterized transport system permease subunit